MLNPLAHWVNRAPSCHLIDAPAYTPTSSLHGGAATHASSSTSSSRMETVPPITAHPELQQGRAAEPHLFSAVGPACTQAMVTDAYF